ncbi:BDM_1a_G0031670.mRNA.1.CDS.1 [Saccharomyces cerevisiae]|nr:BDM_1a_G0031670.mRNA.1.CDS.1 [Saccharomyces cerevisiae]CAI7195840.1 BDM_1a_G0031670.mRNA.1.CDS.1 [Saccharomyces cerevisiae]
MVSDNSEVLLNVSNYHFGDSACAKYLFKIKQLLIKSCHLTSDVSNLDYRTLSLDTSPNISLIEVIAVEVCPPIEEAKKWISAASKVIGADYMFIEPNYESEILESVIYNNEINHANFVEYATELTRFFTYLALGRLFNEDSSPENTRSKFPGLLYFETALKLQGELLKVYDRIANSSLVQSFLYVAFYALSLDKPSFAFMLVGNAIRMMFTLGYHRRVTSSINNRVFWLCYVYDRLVAVRFGFPLAISEFDIEIPLLEEADNTFFSVSLDIYHFVSQVKLAKITTQIIGKIYTRNSVSFIQNCNVVLKLLKNWLDDLPSELKLDYNNVNAGRSRSTINLHINYNYSIIITTRPVLFYVFNKVVATGKSAEELFSKQTLSIIQILLESSVQAAKIQSLHVVMQCRTLLSVLAATFQLYLKDFRLI